MTRKCLFGCRNTPFMTCSCAILVIMKLPKRNSVAIPGKALTLVLTVALLVAVASAGPLKAQGGGSPEMDRQLLSGLYLALGGAGWTKHA